MVLSKSDVTGEISYKRVVNTFVRQTSSIYKVTFENGTILETTWNHPFKRLKLDATLLSGLQNSSGSGNLSMDLSEWTEAKELKSGDLTFTADGKLLAISSIEVDGREETVYNFEVEDFHTYFVGEFGVWVHNQDDSYNLKIRSFIPLDRIAYNSGDNRGFNEEEVNPDGSKVTSRVTQVVNVDLEEGSIIAEKPFSNATHASILGFEWERTADPKSNIWITSDEDGLNVSGHYEASNPTTPPGSPDIDVNFKISLKQNGNILNVKTGTWGDGYPANEVILTDSSIRQNKILLGGFIPETNANPANRLFPQLGFLTGGRPMVKSDISIKLNENKEFTGVINNHDKKEYSIQEWNNKIKNQCPGPSCKP